MYSVIQKRRHGAHSSSVTLRSTLKITGSLSAIISRHHTMCPRRGPDRRVKQQLDHPAGKLPSGGFARTDLSLLGSLIKCIKSLFIWGMAGIMMDNDDIEFREGICLNNYGVLVNGCKV